MKTKIKLRYNERRVGKWKYCYFLIPKALIQLFGEIRGIIVSINNHNIKLEVKPHKISGRIIYYATVPAKLSPLFKKGKEYECEIVVE